MASFSQALEFCDCGLLASSLWKDARAQNPWIQKLREMMSRGVISDKWSARVLWLCAIGSAVGFYMVAVERQTQNRERMLAEALRAEESGSNRQE